MRTEMKVHRQHRSVWRRLAQRLGLQLRFVGRIPDKVRPNGLEDVGYDGRGVIYLRYGIWEPWIFHELAHWLVASPLQRQLVNWGLRAQPVAEEELTASEVTVGLLAMCGNIALAEHAANELAIYCLAPRCEGQVRLARWYLCRAGVSMGDRSGVGRA